uniref:DUF4218 domain-containing protein n=1 Tax=Tanacetum cinerariifolium TaxID=118510 RepID=A0A699H5S1_TANCI|nr:hypothetical protein [Tanacetum cinerariifolium]
MRCSFAVRYSKIMDDIMAQARFLTRVKGKHPMYEGVKIKRNVLIELNWIKRSIFYELEYWSFFTLKHNLDVMHIEKNVLESISNTLLMNDKSKDTTKARQDLKRLGIRSGLWLGQNKNGKCTKPHAAYSFTPGDKKSFVSSSKELNYQMDVAKPIIELCLFFKQICSQTLMEDDMLKAQSKVIDILCNLELIYPPGFFDIMIHLVIHLPLEALEGGPIRPRWMYPFERFMKKLKIYVRNKAKSKSSIAEGYVAEESLNFSSHYFRDVTMKFNRPDRNMDCHPPTCQFQVFRTICKSIGLRSVIRIDHQELKKVIWYVLHNSPEIDKYRVKFKSQFPNKDMKEEFPGWFGSQIRQRHVDKDLGVSASSELFALACETTRTPISVNSCVVNGVRFVVHNRDERRTTQNSSICSPSEDGEMYYGQLEQILEFSYMSFKTVLFRVKWFDTSNKGRVKHLVIRNNITQILANEDDPDIIHVDNSSDLALTTTLNYLEIPALRINGQSIDVDAPLDIINVDEDNDIIDDEDVLPHDLADSDNEDLVNMSQGVTEVTVAVMIVPLNMSQPEVAEAVGTRKQNLGGRKSGRMHTRKETRNLGLKKITDELGPQPIRFEWKDNGTMLPLGDHSAHWANLIGEIVREFSMHFGSWRSIPPERKAGPHMQSELWPDIRKGIDQHLGKIYTDNKLSLKSDYWVKNPDDETYDVEAIRSRRPANISAEDWDAQIRFWSDPKNMARCAQNAQNRAKSTVMQSSATQEYPSLIQTCFDTHTVGDIFLRDEDRRLYEEMVRLHGLGTYTDDQIMAMVHQGKQRGHIPGVDRVLAGTGKDVLDVPVPRCNHTSDVDELKRSNKQLSKQIDMIMKAMSSDDRYSQLFTQLQSQHESESGSGCGAGENDESGDDEDADEDADS